MKMEDSQFVKDVIEAQRSRRSLGWVIFIIFGVAFSGLVINFGLRPVKATEPGSVIIVLSETESKMLIESAQSAEAARTKFQTTMDNICKLKGVDAAKYSLEPNKEQKGIVNLVPIPQTPPAPAQK